MQHVELVWSRRCIMLHSVIWCWTTFAFHEKFDATSFNISFVLMWEQQSCTRLAAHFTTVALAHVQVISPLGIVGISALEEKHGELRRGLREFRAILLTLSSSSSFLSKQLFPHRLPQLLKSPQLEAIFSLSTCFQFKKNGESGKSNGQLA